MESRIKDLVAVATSAAADDYFVLDGAVNATRKILTTNFGATKLATARMIGGSSFDGTANVTSFPSPGAIGGTTPDIGAFTTLSATGTITGGAATFTNAGTITTFDGGAGDAGASRVIHNGDAGTNRIYSWRTGYLPRWALRVNSAAESGSNAGSNWELRRYNDAGEYLDSPLTVIRSTGAATFAGSLAVTGTLSATGKYTQGAGTGIEIISGDVKYLSNAGYGILSADGTRVLAVTNTGLAVTGTLSATGLITSTVAGGSIFINTSAGTSQVYQRITNTSGNMFLGLESSIGGSIITGSSAYDTVLTGKTGLAFSGNDGVGMQMRLTSTGLAVTGTLSATGDIKPGADINSTGNPTVYSSNGGTAGSVRAGHQYIGTTPEIRAYIGGSIITVTSATGLAVMGALSATGSLIVGSGAGTAVVYLGNPSANYIYWDGTSVYHRVASSDRMVVSATGLAVTGTLSATSSILAPAATTSIPSLRIPHGAAPSSPTNGDMWTTTAGLYIRINGATVGPLT